ncbi:unnamed protein product [Peronospora belbahrii]|uniref:Uncharacterized protein n=1 Tax=Peronospora belbahrii TaxID=622444 RepID=A0AAU9KIL4_9STRA|nr:unnamed protein product [Peronospora belbahrii]CAH0474101.1 unnamed protein product [Peronospora belbahrii]CAH0518564.1 unnamed protein product [Peronospora belbahrii]CAH0518568.1 unnamed protein product [Peronospora belbahrii]
MARPRGIDVLFEFDAPQTFQDLSAPFVPHALGEHDVWFDQIHPQHSKPSADLAREAAAIVRKLQDKEQQLKEMPINRKSKRWSRDKENERPKSGDRSLVRNKQLQLQESKKTYTSVKEMRATSEPFQVKKEIKEEIAVVEKRRKPLVDARNRLNLSGKERTFMSGEKKEMRDWQKLLKKHNKKFKATHTYEPSQHSVREVKQWERKMNKSYYNLSVEERVQANQEIAIWKQRQADSSQ